MGRFLPWSLITILCLSTLLHAQVEVSEQWEKVDALPLGNPVNIKMKNGRLFAGSFLRSSPDDIAVAFGRARIEQRFSKLEIREVSATRKDKVSDGILLGAAVGLGFGALTGYGNRSFECRAGCSVAIGVTLFTPLGALFGWLTDRNRQPTEIVYVAR